MNVTRKLTEKITGILALGLSTACASTPIWQEYQGHEIYKGQPIANAVESTRCYSTENGVGEGRKKAAKAAYEDVMGFHGDLVNAYNSSEIFRGDGPYCVYVIDKGFNVQGDEVCVKMRAGIDRDRRVPGHRINPGVILLLCSDK